MLKIIRNQWRAHPLGLTLILLGYLVGVFVVTIGTTVAYDARNYSLDSTSGNPEFQRILHINTSSNRPYYEDLLPILKKVSERSQIQIRFEGGSITGKEQVNFSLLGVLYTQQPEWQVPLINGRHLTPSEAMSSEHVALIGKKLAKMIFPNGIDSKTLLNINDEAYRIIGVVGRGNRETQWDNVIYLPLQALPQQVQTLPQQQIGMYLSENGGSPEQSVELIKSFLQKIDQNITVAVSLLGYPQNSSSQFWNSLTITSILAGTILFVSGINISNLSLFWILDRRKEIAIRKAVGATDGTIIRQILLEMMSLAILATFSAILLSLLLSPFLKVFGLSLQVYWLGWVVSFLVAIICGGITSIVPVRASLKIQPAEVLRVD